MARSDAVFRSVAAYLRSRRRAAPVVFIAVLLLVVAANVATTLTPRFSASRQIGLENVTEDTELSVADGDNDGLSDLDELFRYGTDPLKTDTDGDGLSDDWEARMRRLDPVSGTFKPEPVGFDGGEDLDHDGLSNLGEYVAGTDPWDADSDADGMPDGYEVGAALDPLRADSGEDADDDTILNIDEFRMGTNASSKDTDLDGLEDADELSISGTDPTRYSTSGSGIADGWLVFFQIDPLSVGLAYVDHDGDGLSAQDEFLYSSHVLAFASPNATNRAFLFSVGLNPSKNDTDGDGLGDGWEVRYGLDPLSGAGSLADLDGDGLTNLEEFRALSNPRLADTDSDGLDDALESRGWIITLEDQQTLVTSNAGLADGDGDGLTDFEEFSGFLIREGINVTFPRTHPLRPDSDLDGLGDLGEVTLEVLPRLDPTRADSDGDGMADGEEYAFWEARSRLADERLLERLREERLRGNSSGAETNLQLRSVLGPAGDIDLDGIPNIVDPDSDADSIPDGAELSPPRKRAAPGREDLRILPRTDPALGDTDRDRLPDAWENRFASYNDTLADWNLNATSVDSLRLGDGKTDGARDLDGDGARFYSNGGVTRLAFANLEEFTRGTDPNDADTDDDNITDGWEVFFRLNPLDASDAGRTYYSLPFVRFVAVDGNPSQPQLVEAVRLEKKYNETYSPAEASSGGTGGDVFRGLPKAGGDSRTVVRIHATFELTYELAFLNTLNPDTEDTDGDGATDAWELYYSTTYPDAAIDLSPSNPEGIDADFDLDGLSNVQEYVHGTSPVPTDRGPEGELVGDTDLGGELDGNEVVRGLDPLNGFDDDPNGDLDCDGVANIQERRTQVSHFDTDGDGLLDGPSLASSAVPQGCTLPLAEWSARIRSGGIVERAGTFLGEDDFASDPTACDSDDDGMPDGWEVYYGLNPLLSVGGVNSDTNEADGGDGLDDLSEYRLGLLEAWNCATDGVWWFGGAPRQVSGGPPGSDSDGDGLKDGFLSPDGNRVGDDFDYDNDGLDDFSGEDPIPFYDHNNTGTVNVKDASVVNDWLRGLRTRTQTFDADGDGVPDVRDRARTRLVVETPSASTVLKGGSLEVRGRLLVDEDTVDRNRPVPNAVVLANFIRQSPDSDGIVGVAITDSDGQFDLNVSLAKEHTVRPAAPTVLFGQWRAAGTDVNWTLNTSGIAPGLDAALVVWSYSTPARDGNQSYAARNRDLTGTTRLHSAEGVVAPTPYKIPTPFTIRAATTIQLPAGLKAVNGGNLTASGLLMDAVGDPVAGRIVTVRFNGATQVSATTDASGAFRFTIPVGKLERRGFYEINATFAGDPDGLTLASSSEGVVEILYKTTTTASVENPGRSAVAGETLVLVGAVFDETGRPALGNVSVSAYDATFEAPLAPVGSYRVEAAIPRDVRPESRSFAVTFAEANSLASSSAVAESVIVVQRARVVLDPEYFKALVSEDLTVAGSLLDLTNRPVRDLSKTENLFVRVTVGPAPLDATVDNSTGTFKAVFSRYAITDVGEITVAASFAGTNLYTPATTLQTYSVVTTTSISMPAKRVERGGTGLVEGRLLDALGRPVAGEMVNVTFEGRPLSGAPTDAQGRFTRTVLLPGNKTLGIVEVRAFYPGSADGLKKPSPEVQTLYRVVTRVSMELPDKVLAFGRLNITGRLATDDGGVVPSARVELRVNGVPIGSVLTDFGGEFEAEYLPATTDVVDFLVEARYVGEGIYGEASATASYSTISRVALSIKSLSPFIRGGEVALKGELADEFGRPIRGAPLEMYLGDARLGQLNTISGGEVNATVRLPVDLPRGKYPFLLKYGGDKNHFPAEYRQTVEVVGNPDLRLYMPSRLRVGDSFEANVLLLDDEGEPVRDAVLRVRVSGYLYPFLLKTNDTGEARFPAKSLGEGRTVIDVRYAGGGLLLPATRTLSVSSLATFGPVTREEALLLGVAGLFVLGGAVIAAYLYWRSRGADEAAEIIRRAEGDLSAGNEYIATILIAYRSLVDYFQKYGYVVSPDVTAQEFAAAVKVAFPVDSIRLDEFISIFEEARYSDHPIGPIERERAIRCFRRLRSSLRIGNPPGGTAPVFGGGG